MPFFEAVRLALAQIRVQKLKSFFTLLGVMIGVMFLIAVVSIVEGMGRYMEDDFAGRLLGANTFTLRRYPWFGNNTTRERVAGVAAAAAHLRGRRRVRSRRAARRDALGDREPGRADGVDAVRAAARGRGARRRRRLLHDQEVRPRRRDATIAPQEYELGTPVVVIGDEVAKYFFPNLNPIGRELRIGGIPYQVIGVIEHQGTLFGQSLDKLAIAPFNSPLHRLTNPRGDIDGLLVQSSSAMMMDDVMEIGARGAARASPPAPGHARQLRDGDVGVGARVLREDQEHDDDHRRGAARHQPDRRRHGDHEHHARLGRRADARDRHSQVARRAAARHPAPVPRRVGDAQHARRDDRHRARHARRRRSSR